MGVARVVVCVVYFSTCFIACLIVVVCEVGNLLLFQHVFGVDTL